MKKQHLINFYHKLKTLMSLFAGLCLKAGAYLGDKLEIALEMVEDYFIEESNNLNAGFGKAHKLIGKHKQGFVVDGKRSLSLKESENNMMVIAPSGGGKSSVIIYPTICKLQHSMLVNDNSGELSDCECYLKHYGFKVGYLDFGDLTKSWYYNPLKRIQNPSDIAKISSMLIRTSNSKSDFWTLKSEELLTIMIAFVKNHQPKVHQNLANVYHLLEHLQSEPQTVETLFKENANETLNLKLQGILKNSENTKASIISATLSTLSFIGNDENLQHITSVDTIDFDRFRKEKTVLFLRCPLGDSEYYKKIISLFFEQFFSTVFNKALPDKEDLHISVIADELGSLYLPNLPSIISNARKFKIPILGVLQSENQLFENYGSYNAKTILNNAGVKIYFTGLTDESEKLERVLGKFEYKDDKERIRTRSLMTSDEIRTMPKRNILIIPSGRKPLKVKTTPYYEQAKLKKWIDGDVHIDSHIPSQDYLDKPKQHHQIYKAILLDLSPYKAKQTQLQDVDANFIKIPKYGR